MPPTMLPTVAMAWDCRSVAALSASALAELETFWALVIIEASWACPVSDVLKSFWLAAAWLSALSKLLSGAGALSTLLIRLGSWPSEFGAVSVAAIEGVVVGRVTGAIVGAVSDGLSCQFQNRVRSSFSPDGQWPSTASPRTPRVGSAMIDCGETKLCC